MRRRILLCGLGLVLALEIVVYWFAANQAPDDEGMALDENKVLGRHTDLDGSGSIEVASQPYRLNKVYRSMTGPRGNQAHIRLVEDDAGDEVLWLTGLETAVVAADTLGPVANEYFCHSNLTLNPEATKPEQHNASFSPPTHADWRLFTLVPGRMNVRLPEGFGVPVRAATDLDYFTMALNQNPGHPDQQVRMKTTIRFRRGDSGAGLKPLFRRGLYVYQRHRESPPPGSTGAVAAKLGHQGADCAEACARPQFGATPSQFFTLKGDGLDRHPGATCCVSNASSEGFVPQFGPDNTVHWMTPPGKHTYRSEVSAQMDLPFDTTVHYVTGHLHPFGKAMKLIDLETGKLVFQITAACLQDRLGVSAMSEITALEGVPIFKGRRYELVAEYDNTSPAEIDAMAILYLYARDQLPEKHSAATAAPSK